MKKALSLAVALVMLMALCACSVNVNVTTDGAAAPAADGYVVTLINGMDNSVYGEYDIAAGEDFVFSISCAAPCDMGPYADGEIGSGVTATCGTVTYSNVTTGGPNAYPTAETVTVSGIDADCTVTVTPNPDEVGSVFPTITIGEAAASGSASGEASAEPASDEPASEEPASDEASAEPAAEGDYPLFDEYKEYLFETMMQDSFWQGNEANLRAGLDAATSPLDESIQNFTGSGAVDQAPAGVVFPMTYDVWYAEQGGEAAPAAGGSSEDAYHEYLHEWLLNELANNSSMTIEQVEDEFMPLINANDYVSFPAEMLFNGMLNTGMPMTFEEWVAAQ